MSPITQLFMAVSLSILEFVHSPVAGSSGEKNTWTPGVALGLLLYKPQLMIAPGVMFLVRWRWRALIGVAFGAGLWVAVGLALCPEAMTEYVRVYCARADTSGCRRFGLSRWPAFQGARGAGWMLHCASL